MIWETDKEMLRIVLYEKYKANPCDNSTGILVLEPEITESIGGSSSHQLAIIRTRQVLLFNSTSNKNPEVDDERRDG